MKQLNARELYEMHNDAGNAESVNSAFDCVQLHLKSCGLKTANDDRAERLVTAITEYIYESGNFAP